MRRLAPALKNIAQAGTTIVISKAGWQYPIRVRRALHIERQPSSTRAGGAAPKRRLVFTKDHKQSKLASYKRQKAVSVADGTNMAIVAFAAGSAGVLAVWAHTNSRLAAID